MIKILDDTIDLSQISLNDNGLGKLEIISGTDTEELNGIYEAEFTCLMTEKYFDQLHVEGLVALPTEKGEQIFRIYYISKPLNKVVTVKCRHITYDLTKTIVQPFEATGSAAAVAGILSNVMTATPFTITTDISNSTSVFQLTQPRAFRQILGGYQGSFLDVFRGEYEWDNLEVKMLARRGADRGVRIAYRKNLTGCKMELDSSAVYTSVMAYVNIDNNVVYGNVYHKITATYPKVLILDASNDYSIDNIPTAADLTTYAQNYATNNDIESPKLTASIEFVPLWQTDEYKEVAPLERVSLGDTVHADVSEMGMTATARVIKTVWNLNTQRYDSLILGSVKSSLASIIQSTVQTARDEAEKATSVVSGQMNEIASLIINGLGLHRTLVPTADGGYKVYLHNHATLADSDVQYYMSANGIMVSTDYGQTWNAGFDAEGNAVLNSLATITLKALEIYGSKIVFGDIDNKYIIADEYQKDGEDVGISFDGSGYVRFQPHENFEVVNLSTGDNVLNQFDMVSEDENGLPSIQLVNYDTDQTKANEIILHSTGETATTKGTKKLDINNYLKGYSDIIGNSLSFMNLYSYPNVMYDKPNIWSHTSISNRFADNYPAASVDVGSTYLIDGDTVVDGSPSIRLSVNQHILNSENNEIGDAVSVSLSSSEVSDFNDITLQVRGREGGQATASIIIHDNYETTKLLQYKGISMMGQKVLYSRDGKFSWATYDDPTGYKEIGKELDWLGTIPYRPSTSLNTYTACGISYIESNSWASTMLDSPTQSAFTLRVWDPTGEGKSSGWAYRIQEITTYDGNKFYRTGSTGGGDTWTWSAWRRTQTTTSYTYTFGSHSSVVALRSGTTVTLICQINTVDLGSMSAWQTKNICTLNEVYRHGHGGAMLFPVIHDSTMNSGGAIAVYNSGWVQFQTRAGSLPGVSSTAWVNATCTYAVW